MPGSEANANPLSFARAPHDEAVGRLVEVVRRTRPQVMVIYGDEQSGYPHPDHLRVHEIGLAGFDAAADSALYPDLGPAWQVNKLYYTLFSVARFRQLHEKFLELGLESPFDEGWRKRWDGVPAEPVSASIDISDFADVRREALLGPRHPGRSQIAFLVRPPARGDAVDSSIRRLPPGPGRPAFAD